MDVVRILTVCSGNICRSPLAELMMAEGLRDIPGFEFASAGTMAKEDDLMPAQAQRLGTAFGVDPTRHRARYLTTDMVQDADLLFAMARSHRSQIVTHAPSKISKTFTIREFARLSATLTDAEVRAAATEATVKERVDSVVRAVFSRKGFAGPAADPELDDVIDPYRRSDATYERSGQEIDGAVREVVRVLRIAGTPPSAG